MAGAALLATTLAPALSTGAVPYVLFMGGADVGVGTTVDRDSIDVTEAGPGGVSSMHFTIYDPGLAFAVDDGMDVLFWDRVTDLPLFRGWVQSWAYRTLAATGRYIDVTCIGVEALLDWAVTTVQLTFLNAAVLDLSSALQSVAANTSGVGALRAFTDGALSSQEYPTGPCYVGAMIQTDTVIPAGTTLREALRRTQDASAAFLIVNGLSAGATVDFYMGLRSFMMNDSGRRPLDYVTLTVTDTLAGVVAAEGLAHDVDASAIVRGVYVVGGNALGSGLVSDGSGRPGPIAVLSDSTILTAADRDSAGQIYLAGFAAGVRGTFSLSGFVPVSNRISAGGYLTLTDAGAGQSAVHYQIGSIHKTFEGQSQHWDVAYGGFERSAMRSMRRLTRDTLS